MARDYKNYAVRKTREDADFAREALNYLVSLETPGDIFEKGEFKPITDNYGAVFVIDGSVNTSYNGQAGTDKKEEYLDKDSNGNLVKKTRTVTEWSPISGNHMYSGYGACITADDPNKYAFNLSDIVDFIPYQENMEFEAPTPFEVKNDVIKIAEQSIISKAEADTAHDIRNSYDHIKNLRYSSSVNADSNDQYMIPTQDLPFVYEDREYCVSAFAIQGAQMTNNGPSVSDDITNQVKKLMNYSFTRPLVINILLAVVAGIVVFFLAKNPQTYVTAFAVGLFAIIAIIVYYFVYKKVFNNKRKAIVEELKEHKRQTVEKVLAKYNY